MCGERRGLLFAAGLAWDRTEEPATPFLEMGGACVGGGVSLCLCGGDRRDRRALHAKEPSERLTHGFACGQLQTPTASWPLP